MERRDVAEFTQVLGRVGTLYGKSISKPLVETYWAALKDFDLAAVRQAFSRHSLHPDTGKFMPKPSDVVCALQGDSHTQARLAWSKVVKAMREIGSYDSVIFDDLVIHAVIADMGGWVSLCHVPLKELPFREKDFVARYAGYVGHPPAEYPKALTGLLEHQNGLTGHPAEPPVCIGDPHKALSVFEQGVLRSCPYSALPSRKAGECQAPVLSNPFEENHA
jgi:hypothetical protein